MSESTNIPPEIQHLDFDAVVRCDLCSLVAGWTITDDGECTHARFYCGGHATRFLAILGPVFQSHCRRCGHPVTVSIAPME